MIVKVSGRSASILAAGLFVCFACPSQAAAGAGDTAANAKSENAARAPVALHKNLRHGAYHRKHFVHARHDKVALKPAEEKPKPAEDRKTAATNLNADNGAPSSELPLSVANANAQAPSPGGPVATATAMPAWANDATQATSDNAANAKADNGSVIVAADQLNDVDRTLRERNAPAAGLVAASANPPAAPVVANGRENSTWDQTSLIGKIFIGFGALLTMASAARMFIA